MSKSMRILRAFLISLLVVLCIIFAVIVFINPGEDGNNDDAQLSGGTADSEIADSGQTGDADAATGLSLQDDGQVWRRSTFKPLGSDYWHFFPIIPDDASPGDTVVLSASVRGFIGWEVDENYADVELFDSYSDGISMFISFVMPNEEVVIRSLHDDTLFEGVESYDDSFISASGLREDGEFSPFSTGGTLPSGMVGVPYDGAVPMPPNFHEDNLYWVFLTGPDESTIQLSGLSFNPVNGRVTGTPHTPSPPGQPFRLLIDLFAPAVPPETIPSFQGRHDFSITIMPRPVFDRLVVPDGMAGVDYNNVEIRADSIPSGRVPQWRIGAGNLPPGLEVWDNNYDTFRIFGEPDASAIGNDYTFVVVLRLASAANPDEYVEIEQNYAITIWAPPVIELIPPPDPLSWIDGMVGQDYEAGFRVRPGSSTVPITPTWTWSISDGALPNGVTLDPDTGIISGEPTTDGDFNFTIRYTADRGTPSTKGIIGYAETEVPGFIWPRPTIGIVPSQQWTENPSPQWPADDVLPDGMVGPLAGSGEAAETYRAELRAEDLPDDTISTTWAVGSGSLPVGATPFTLSAANGVITGTATDTTAAGVYDFRVDLTIAHLNRNIDGAVIPRSLNINIWQRAYLSVEIKSLTVVWPNGDVGRRDVLGDWQLGRRAVIPGTVGHIRSVNIGFMRWEINQPTNQPDLRIGKWDLVNQPGNVHSSVEIQMPKPASADAAAINVHIEGWPEYRGPKVHPDYARQLTVGNPENRPLGSFFLVDPDDPRNPPEPIDPTDPVYVGQGPLGAIRWAPLTEGTERWPPGLSLHPTLGTITSRPTEVGTFTFRIRLTLPGTMEIIYGPFTINVDEHHILVGDVDGDGRVTLSDLVLLARALDTTDPGVTLADLRNPEAAKILPGSGPPGPADLHELARWFARQQR